MCGKFLKKALVRISLHLCGRTPCLYSTFPLTLRTLPCFLSPLVCTISCQCCDCAVFSIFLTAKKYILSNLVWLCNHLTLIIPVFFSHYQANKLIPQNVTRNSKDLGVKINSTWSLICVIFSIIKCYRIFWSWEIKRKGQLTQGSVTD